MLRKGSWDKSPMRKNILQWYIYRGHEAFLTLFRRMKICLIEKSGF